MGHTYYTQGFQRHPHFLNPANSQDPEAQDMRRRYGLFRDWIWAASHIGPVASPSYYPGEARRDPSSGRAIFVTRLGKRRLLNRGDLLDAARAHPSLGEVSEVSLEDLPFTEQLEVFQGASVIIAQYGSACHNVLFLRPGSILVLLMQPRWCEWAWAYASQALLLGVHTLVYCDEADTPTPLRFRWHHLGWAQGPWQTKDRDYSVDVAAFRRLLDHVPDIWARQGQGQGQGQAGSRVLAPGLPMAVTERTSFVSNRCHTGVTGVTGQHSVPPLSWPGLPYPLVRAHIGNMSVTAAAKESQRRLRAR